jgi:hypothetical protein
VLEGIASNEPSIERSQNINANTSGNKTVQQKDISGKKRIRGKYALTHTNVKTSIQTLIPSAAPDKTPSKKGMLNCLIIPSYTPE